MREDPEIHGARLSVAPWVWPLVTGPEEPPGLRPGEVAVVTTNATTTALWLVSKDAAVPDVLPCAEFVHEARDAWARAVAALPRSVRHLWKSLDGLAEAPPRAWRVAHALCRRGSIEQVESRIEGVNGPSCGLAFVLSLASRLFLWPVRADVVATAAVEADGTVRPVAEVERKVRFLVEKAPRVRTVLVAHANGDEAERAAEGRLDVIRVACAAEAVAVAVGDSGTALARDLADPQSRADAIISLFRMALRGRMASVDWNPVEEAALYALKRCGPDIGEVEGWKLRFAAAVAARHERNAGEMPLPAQEWLSGPLQAVRVDVIAHLVQHCADTGTPPPESVNALAEAAVASNADHAEEGELRLLGALGRLRAITGDPQGGLALQRDATLAWVKRHPEEASYSLSAWFRLAGALGDASSLDEAERARDRILRQLPGYAETPYVVLYRCSARLLLGRSNAADIKALRRLATNEGPPAPGQVPEHVRWAAIRWLVRYDQAERLHWEPELRRARDAKPPDQEDPAAETAALAGLDTALARHEETEAGAAVEELRRRQRAIVDHLLRAADSGGHSRASYVANFYPY